MAPIDNIRAHCLCGAVHVQTKGRPFDTLFCHCSRCQRFTGMDFEHAVCWDWDNAKIVKGHESVDFLQTSEPVRRNYCRWCSSAILTEEAIPGMRPRKIVPAGVLEHGEDGRLVCWDDPALQPSCHIFYDTHILDFEGDGVPKWEGFPHKSKRVERQGLAVAQHSRM